MSNRLGAFIKKKENRNRALIVLGIVLVVFNVLAFVLPFELNTTFWIAYAFTLVAIAAQAGVTFLAFNKGTMLRSKVLGFPIFEIGIGYLAVQLVVCFAFMTIASFVEPPEWAVVVPCVLIAAFAAICILLMDAGRDEIARQDTKVRADTSFMRLLTADVQSLLPRATVDEDKAALGRLAEALRHSDPVHVDGLEGVEAEMSAAFLAIKQQVQVAASTSTSAGAGAGTSAGTGAAAQIEELTLLLNERNTKCKVLKQQAL